METEVENKFLQATKMIFSSTGQYWTLRAANRVVVPLRL